MSIKKKHIALISVPGAIIILALAILIILPGIAGSASNSDWGWTKKNPKPSWWRWGKSYYPEKPVRGGYTHFASGTTIGLMNPNHWPVLDWATLFSMYDLLILPEGNYKPIVPWLAKSWKYVNPTTVIMKLRKSVQFTDGSYFNAETLKFQIEWIKNKKNFAWSRRWIEPLKSIEIVDKYTVRWHFKHPWANFADMFANVPGWMISAKALKADTAIRDSKILKKRIKTAKRKLARYMRKGKTKKAEKTRKQVQEFEKRLNEVKALAKGNVTVDEKAAGSGRFMLEEHKPGNYTKLKRHPNWWFGKTIGMPDMPYFDGNKITVIPEKSVQLANLKAGKIDSMDINKAQYAQVKDDPNLNVYITPLNFNITLTFNHNTGPCRDIRVRKAISHAIDRKGLIAANEQGFGRIASCFFPDDHYAHNPGLKPVSYNPELTKKLLAQAGYKNGLTVKGYLPSNTISVRYGQIIKSMLKKANINWDLEFLDGAAIVDKYVNLQYDVGTYVGIFIKDPDAALTTYYYPDPASTYPSRTKNKQVVSLIKKARRELNPGKRTKIYHRIEKAIYDNYEDAWLYYYTSISASRKHLRGYNREMQIKGGEAYWPAHPGWFKNGKRH